jgi:hypothetical protein
VSGAATVELLAAEVRVLMVGSRQITTSVAKQLDRVEWEELAECFGRVRLEAGDHRPGVTGFMIGPVIGRTAGGVLALSHLSSTEAELEHGKWNFFRTERSDVYDSLPLIVLAGLR